MLNDLNTVFTQAILVASCTMCNGRNLCCRQWSESTSHSLLLLPILLLPMLLLPMLLLPMLLLLLLRSGGVRTMMITGDYHHTAIAVARDVGIVKPQGMVIVIDTATSSQPILDPPLLTPHDSLQPPLQIPHTLGGTLPSADWHRFLSIQQLPGAVQQADDRHSRNDDQSQDQQHVALTADPVIKTRHVSWDHVLEDNTGMSQGKQAVLPQSSAAVKTNHVSKLLQFPALAKAKSGLALSETPQPVPPESRRLPWEGLTFVAAGLGNLNASQALAALAAGQMQCAVTGDALESLLQQRDLSSLETVMSNAVVFSRMQPHQKGQVMDLLSTRGMHQLFDGQPRFIQVPHAMACDCWCRLSH